MKILHIDPDDIDNPLSGGGPMRTYEIYRRLAHRHEITVLTPTFPGSRPETIRNGIRYVRLGRKIGNHGSSHHITFFFALHSALQHYEYDLLVQDFMPPMSVTLAPLLSRKPLIASVQWFSARYLSAQYRLPFYLGERYGVRMYRHFVVLTESMRRMIVGMHPGAQCEVVPNAVEESLFDIDFEFGRYILFLGLVSLEQKGVDLLLRAYSLIPEEERLPLVFAGHGFEWDMFNALIDQLKLRPWIQLVGRVNNAQRSEILRRARFVCVPSREETFGMVSLESCAAGKRAILFDKGPMNEVAAPSEACLFVPPFDVRLYADAMRKMLHETPAAMHARGLECRNWARRFGWDGVALQQEEFYCKVVSNRHPAKFASRS